MKSSSTYRVIGVMSGTSLDGIDLCEIEFTLKNDIWHFEIFETETVGYSAEWVDILKNAHRLGPAEVDDIDKKYSLLLAEIIKHFKTKCGPIDLVCSHGHTIWHEPHKGITKQIGNLKLLQEKLNTTVVCDFRTNDVKLGGQGAPLVPVGDRLLFSEYTYCLNIGGFANVSFEENGERIAYDICPANKVLNSYAEQLGFAFDENGALAKSGQSQTELFNQLNQLEYYKKQPPKSLGVEWVELCILPLIESFQISTKDKLNTFCHHIAFQLAKAFQQQRAKILLTGGGVYNTYLIQLLKETSPDSTFIIPDQKTTEYKEALIFGLLGVLKYRNEVNVLSSVTGAKYNHSSGVVFRNWFENVLIWRFENAGIKYAVAVCK